MTNRDRHHKLEFAAQDELIIRGYIIVFRGAGSEGPFNLIAISPTDIVLVQVRKKGAKQKADIEELRKIQVPKNVRKEIWVRIPHKGWNVTQVNDGRS